MASTTSSLRPNAKDLWTTAVATLSEQDKTTLNLDCPNRLQAIAECLELTDKARNQCKEKAWRFRRKSGEEVVARDVLAKVARWINHFKAVGDTLVQYDPAHAALPWAGNIITAQADMERCLNMANTQEQLDRLTTLKDDLARLKGPMARWSNELAKVTDGLERSKRTEILRWISSEPYGKHHKRECETFLEGTGEWLISHPIFQQWKDESASSLLWLHGIPGSGKSKLTSLVIEDAMEAFQRQQAPSPAYFYCSRNPAEPGRSDPEKILASIVRQFSSPAPGKPLLQPMITTYQSQEDEGFPNDSLQLRDSYELLLKLLNSYPTATIIIDALDECDPRTRQSLLDKLEGVLRESSTLIKIFVSSRDDQDIKYKLRGYPALELSSDLNSVDIGRFVKYETKSLIEQGKLLQLSNRQDDLVQKIIQEVSNGAHGMFRWASLQLQALCDLVTDKAILERLGRLPQTLKELYQEILDKIQRYSAEADRVYAKSALAWLLCGRRRLSADEFLAAISTTDRPTEPLSKNQVLQLCSNFVIFDSTVDSFRFAHLSVREFLEGQPAYRTSTINSIAARCCLAVLMSDDRTAQESYLVSYASCYWPLHCKDAADERESGPLQILLDEFLSNTTPQSPFNAWNEDVVLYCDIDQGLQEKLNASRPYKPCSLYVASVFDFIEIVKSITQQETDWMKLRTCAKLSATYGSGKTLEVFLDLKGSMVAGDMVKAAAGNRGSGKETNGPTSSEKRRPDQDYRRCA
ncbi:hypothetical protein NPX13_g6720 [Xylaria arbuscula]|uniref:NACHT domain-containing protein n=1 Tax=Xylaria arbuscula TaxID=114810 RepID=A0A9W8TLG9_9PEZI|nr:hypothetical protein NPX13_g6720 [Xylaria arbuscula]